MSSKGVRKATIALVDNGFIVETTEHFHFTDNYTKEYVFTEIRDVLDFIESEFKEKK